MNVYLRDRTTGTTTLVSINSSGTGAGNGDSIPTALSTNGQFALFESTASDLVSGDTNNASDVFLRNMVNGTNALVSISAEGGCGTGSSWQSVMTPDGHSVAFASTATNLVMNDTNGIQDIFVRDMQSGTTVLVSPGALAVASSSSSDTPKITPGGRYVAFLSSATNLVYPDGSIVFEVYVRDLVSGTTILASTNAHNFFTNKPVSYSHAISDDGQYVAFESQFSAAIIQRYNLQTGLTDIVSTNAIGNRAAYKHFRNVDMTPDGRFITYIGHSGTNYQTTNTCVFVWDAQSGATTLVSTNLNGSLPTDSVCDGPTIDPTGRWITFLCTATNLVTNVVAGSFHLYVHDMQQGTTTLVDAGTNNTGLARDFLSSPQLTPDGRFITFDCTDGDLVAHDSNVAYDVFVRDLVAGTNELISARHPTLPSHAPNGINYAPFLSVSWDGRYVVYSAHGKAALSGGYTNTFRGVFMRDLLAGTNVLVSAATNGLQEANGYSTNSSISGDGRYVAFTSSATNLIGIDNNNSLDVFVRDLQSGTNVLASVNASGARFSTPSWSPQASTNGQNILFFNSAGNALYWRNLQSASSKFVAMGTVASMTDNGRFVAAYTGGNMRIWDSQSSIFSYTRSTPTLSKIAISPDTNRIAGLAGSRVYVGDRAANTNWIIASSGSLAVVPRSTLKFSSDSQFLLFVSATNVVANDTNGVADVYLYDFQNQTNYLISQSCNWPSAGNGASDSASISSDGRFIVYRSTASDIVPGDFNDAPDIFLKDRLTGITTLLSASGLGNFAANRDSSSPVFSADGQTVVFQSWASDLTADDFNQGQDFFAFKLYSADSIPAFAGQIVFVPAAGQQAQGQGGQGQNQTLAIVWQIVPGKGYQVEFKDDLNDPAWQPLNGSVTVVGDRAQAIDLAPNAASRFYRILGL